MRFVDLSVEINEQTPVYPGDPPVKIKPAGVFDQDGYNDHYVSIGTHAGTHIDAPLHMLKNGVSLDKIELNQFVGEGKYIEVDSKKFNLEVIKQAGIQEGEIVLFHTGMSELIESPAYFEDYPEIPEEVANYLVEKKIKAVGMDMCSPDHPPYRVHKILLSGGVLIIENLTNLGQLKGNEFTVYALPLKLQVDGAPARVVAQIKE